MEETQTNLTNQTFSTPMMKQYQEIKEQHPDCLLFFRLGDFYELFNDDAKLGAQILNITLTRRPRGKDGDIPMAGVPFHAADVYIAKLVKAGHKVAICEQMSEPDNHGIVDREVIRIVTPGTILDEKSLEKNEHNYTMSLSLEEKKIGLAVADLSTGDFQTTELLIEDQWQPLVINEIARFAPAECIVNTATYNNHAALKTLSLQKNMNIYGYGDWDDLAEDASKILSEHFQVKTLQGFGLDDKPAALRSCAALLGYLKHTQKNRIDHIKSIRTYYPEDFVILDRSSIVNLELFTTLREQEHRGSFIQVLDHTTTAMGGRMLRTWIRKPLRQKQDILLRLDSVEELFHHRILRDILRTSLRQIADIPRLLSRLSVGIGNAYDLVNLKSALKLAQSVRHTLEQAQAPLLIQLNDSLSAEIDQVIEIIEKNILENPALDTKSGNLIKSGVSEELDQLRAQVGGGKNWIAKLEIQERERTGISSLKIKFNQVFGYFIEISKANLHLAPENYIRKQTMVNAERFITPKLKEYEEKILTSQETINSLEYQIYLQVVNQVLSHTPLLQTVSESLAMLDCLTTFAEIAEKNNYCKPSLNATGEIEIKDGRHPVVEKLVSSQFVPNDTNLNGHDHQLLILTGPNMAGKSVFMRQVALITLMAHLGCFVPAKQANISLVDRIFVRSGASDVIASGLSTFMVEMVETAHILNHATNQSLIIMDEIGRGTSTYDGISIAWAVAQYLVSHPSVSAKTLFATHYHELQQLEDLFPDRIKNYNVIVEQKQDGDPIFLHKVMPGRASHSYAIAVAKLAGVPEEVTKNADQILQKLETSSLSQTNSAAFKADKLILAQMTEELKNINLSDLTPIEALNKLSQWQKKL